MLFPGQYTKLVADLPADATVNQPQHSGRAFVNERLHVGEGWIVRKRQEIHRGTDLEFEHTPARRDGTVDRHVIAATPGRWRGSDQGPVQVPPPQIAEAPTRLSDGRVGIAQHRLMTGGGMDDLIW